MAGKFMKAPADAALAAKGAAKGRKAQKRSGSGVSGLDRFRRFTSPSGLTVRPPPSLTLNLSWNFYHLYHMLCLCCS